MENGVVFIRYRNSMIHPFPQSRLFAGLSDSGTQLRMRVFQEL